MPSLGDIGPWIDAHGGILDAEKPEARPTKIDGFERILAIVVATEYWARAIPLWTRLGPLQQLAVPVATILCGVILLAPSRRRPAFAVLAAMHAATVAGEFPAAGNHAYLEVVLLALAALLGPGAGDLRLHLRALRWLVVLVLVTSGLQKLVHGYWLQGHYLAFSAWTPSFRPVLAFLMPADELARLAGYRREIGDGPYLVHSLRLIAASNAVWIGEILGGLLLLAPRLRTLAVGVTILLLAGIEIGARELFFGVLFGHMTLLFLPGDVTSRLVWPTASLMLALLASRIGVLPAMTFY